MTSQEQQAKAWEAVVHALHKVSPGWTHNSKSGEDAAVATIYALAQRPAPEARAIEPWMLDRVIDHLTMSGWFLDDYQNMSVKEVLTKWKDSLPPQNTHEEG